MNQILYLLLGALLALWGGIISQRYQNRLNQKKEDRELLHQSFKILVKLEPSLGKQPYPLLNLEQKELCNELLFNANKIYEKKYHNLAKKLIEFAEKDNNKTKLRALSLKEEIIKKSKKPLFVYLKKERNIWKSLRKFSKKWLREIKKEQKAKEGN